MGLAAAFAAGAALSATATLVAQKAVQRSTVYELVDG
jgi:hypothetical protein